MGRVFWWAFCRDSRATWSRFTGSIPLHDFADVDPSVRGLPMLLLAAIMALFSGTRDLGRAVCDCPPRLPDLRHDADRVDGGRMASHLFSDRVSVEPARLHGLSQSRTDPVRRIHRRVRRFGADRVLQRRGVSSCCSGASRARLQTWSLGALTALMLAVLGLRRVAHRQADAARRPGSSGSRWCRATSRRSHQVGPEVSRYQLQRLRGRRPAGRAPSTAPTWSSGRRRRRRFSFSPTINIRRARRRRDLSHRAAHAGGDTGEPILFGAPALGAPRTAGSGSTIAPTWSRPQARWSTYYDKIQLVPFGEYVPMRPLLGLFVNRIVHGFGDMIRGHRQTLFHGKGRAARRADLLREHLSRPHAARGKARRRRAGQYHQRRVVRREFGAIPGARDGGDALGRDQGPDGAGGEHGDQRDHRADGSITARTPLFKRGTEIEDVSWRPLRTVYTMVGDLFAEICFVLTLVGVLLAILRGPGAQTDTVAGRWSPQSQRKQLTVRRRSAAGFKAIKLRARI